MFVSAYCCYAGTGYGKKTLCVLILLYVCLHTAMCPHTAAMLVQATARRLYGFYCLLPKHPSSPSRPQV